MSYIVGPALVTVGGVTFLSRGGVTITENHETFAVETEVSGKLREHTASLTDVISFVPDGRVNASIVGLFDDVLAQSIGAPLAGAANEVIIHGMDGMKRTYTRGAIVKLPTFTFSSRALWLEGQMQIECLPDTAGNYFTAAQASFPALTDFDPDDVITALPSIDWRADTHFQNMKAKDGIKLNVNLGLNRIGDDELGLAEITLKDIMVEASFIPVGPTEAQWRAVTARGSRRPGTPVATPGSANLVITAGLLQATLYYAEPKTNLLNFSATQTRQDVITFGSSRAQSTGIFTRPARLVWD